MPTKRIFDLTLLTIILTAPALGVVKIAARRWARESNGPMGVVGGAVKAL